MELSEEFVEQVSVGGGVAVAVFASAPIMVAGGCAVRGGGEGPHPADGGEAVVLMCRWVIDRERRDALVMGAEPA